MVNVRIVTISTAVLVQGVRQDELNFEAKLVNDLLTNCNPRVRPTVHNGTVNVTVSLMINQIVHLVSGMI